MLINWWLNFTWKIIGRVQAKKPQTTPESLSPGLSQSFVFLPHKQSWRTSSFKSSEPRAAPAVTKGLWLPSWEDVLPSPCPVPAGWAAGAARGGRGRGEGAPAAAGEWEASAAGKQQLRFLIRFGGGVGGVCGKSQAMDLPFF